MFSKLLETKKSFFRKSVLLVNKSNQSNNKRQNRKNKIEILADCFRRVFALFVIILAFSSRVFAAEENLQQNRTNNPAAIGAETRTAEIDRTSNPNIADNEKPKLWAFTAGISFNEITVSIERKIPLFKSDNILFKENHLAMGLLTTVRQSQAGIGPFIRLSPIAIFDLTVACQYVYQWFGYEFNSANDSIDGDIISDRMKDGPYKTQQGVFLTISPMLKMKFGPVMISNLFTLYYMDMNKSKYFFNWNFEHIQKAGFNYLNSTNIGFFLTEKIVIGLGNTLIRVTDAGYSRVNASLLFMVLGFKGISKSDTFMLGIHYVYHSRYKLNDFITGIRGLVIDLSYEISFNW